MLDPGYLRMCSGLSWTLLTFGRPKQVFSVSHSTLGQSEAHRRQHHPDIMSSSSLLIRSARSDSHLMHKRQDSSQTGASRVGTDASKSELAASLFVYPEGILLFAPGT